jgi:phytoene dehydrogenase-like protein
MLGKRDWDVIIIGAGHNGLVAAAYLARAGLKVLVQERRDVPGGAVATEERFGGFLTSPCAMQLYRLQSKVVEDLGLLGFGLRVAPMDPSYVTPFEDGRVLIQWRDVARTQEEIARFSVKDAAAYPEWVDFWQRVGQLFGRYTLDAEPPTLAELRERAAGTDDGRLLSVLSSWPIRRLMDRFFESEQVQAALMPNSDTKSLDQPGELLGWAMTAPNRGARPEHQGVPIGGMGSVGRALARAAEQYGAEIGLGAEVAQIHLDEAGRACGVDLADGTTLRCRTVVSNADPKRTFGQLLDSAGAAGDTAVRVGKLDTDSGSLKFHAAVSELPDLSAHLGTGHDPRLLGMLRIVPSISYIENSLADAAAGRATDYPILIVQTSTVYDPSAAPEGSHLVSVRVKFEPSRLRQGSWCDHKQALAQQVIDLLTAYAPNFRRSVIDHVLYTPDDIEQRMGLTDGNIHHINHIDGQLLGDRLFPGGGYCTPVAGLYMCGAGTHPGGEVTGANGYNAAKVVLASLRQAG